MGKCENAHGLGFLSRKLHMPPACTAFWLTDQEFVDRVRGLMVNGITVNDENVYDIMIDIYTKREYAKRNHIVGEFEWFFLPTARRGLRAMAKFLGKECNLDGGNEG